MKKLGIVVCLLWMMGMPMMADDASLIRMDGKVVYLSEFLWHFDRDGEKNVQQYFHRFLEYQLKVADARSRRLDTLPDFRRQAEFLQARVLKKHFMDRRLTDSCCQRLTAELAGHRSEKEWMRMDVFTYRYSQHASAQEESQAVRVMDAWGKYLTKVGTPKEADLAWAAEHGVTRQLDAGEWTSSSQLLKELLYRQANLSIGTWSKPFNSPMGIHVVRVVERRTVPGNEWSPQLEQYLEQKGMDSPAFHKKAYEAWKEGRYQLPEEVQHELNGVYEGLLAIYWEQRHQSQASDQQISKKELETYFHHHKENYRWEYPHYKGAVVHCLNKKAASKIRKKLKKQPIERWEETLNRLQKENPKYQGELEWGLFQIGKNAYVDHFAFKCGPYCQHPNYPYTFLMGKKLKKGPEDYTDVLSQVTADYVRERENDRFSQLFARFNVEINEDVLKTVNSCGNK